MLLNDILAYLDPASGGIVIQLLVGAVVGGGIYFRRAIARVFRLFGASGSN